GVDVGVVDDTEVRVLDQTAPVSVAVGAGMRDEAVTERRGEPVHERDVAENVATAQVNAVRLEWVEPVGCVEDAGASRSQDARDLADRLPVVLDVLDDLVQDDDVHAAVTHGERLPSGGEEA